jgi:23S rRNA (adenine2503-C2)-methyltransferase
MNPVPQNTLLGMDRADLTLLMRSLGEPPYRANQILDAVYRQRVESTAKISTLPQPLKTKLEEAGFAVGLPHIEQRFLSQDGTVRYLIGFPDNQSDRLDAGRGRRRSG